MKHYPVYLQLESRIVLRLGYCSGALPHAWPLPFGKEEPTVRKRQAPLSQRGGAGGKVSERELANLTDYQLSKASACSRNTWRSIGSVITPCFDKCWLILGRRTRCGSTPVPK
jgi:hypothetical protein